MSRRLTPQEKKILSYQRDRRNDYGESDKGSRRTIRRSKALGERAYRSNVNQALRSADADADLDASAVRRRKFNKSPDAPLAEYLEGPWRRRGAPRLAPSSLRNEAKRRLRRGQ